MTMYGTAKINEWYQINLFFTVQTVRPGIVTGVPYTTCGASWYSATPLPFPISHSTFKPSTSILLEKIICKKLCNPVHACWTTTTHAQGPLLFFWFIGYTKQSCTRFKFCSVIMNIFYMIDGGGFESGYCFVTCDAAQFPWPFCLASPAA